MLLVAFPLQVRADSGQNTAGDVLNASALDEIDEGTAGVMIGTPQEEFIKENLPNVKFLYFNTFSDLIIALQENKIDFFVQSEQGFRLIKEDFSGIGYIDNVLKTFDNGAIFPKTEKGEKLRSEFNEYIAKIKADGTLDDLSDYWLWPKDFENVDIPQTGKNGVLEFGIVSTNRPYCLLLNEEYAGFDVAVVAGFCKEYGYGIHFNDVDFAGLLAGVSSGKFDIGASQVAYTEERSKSVLFSDFYYDQKMKPIVMLSRFSCDYLLDEEDENSNTTKLEYNNREELAKAKNFGSVTGTIMDKYTKEFFPDAEIFYFNNLTDIAIAIRNGQIDAALYDQPTIAYLSSQYDNLGVISEYLLEEDYHFIFPKNEKGKKLQEEFNEWLAGAKESGFLDEAREYWLSNSDDLDTLVDGGLTGEKGTLNLPVEYSARPDVYLKNEKAVGYPMDILKKFCKDCGYATNFENVTFDSGLAGTAAGKYDMQIGFISKTTEREESYYFSDSVYSGGMSALVRNADLETSEMSSDTTVGKNGGFWGQIKKSLVRTFVDENRWKVIVSGLGVTLLITTLGFLLANLFGALFCAMSLSKIKLLNVIADVYSRIMQGLPIVVILMILFYIVFGKTSVSGVTVSIMGFGITTGAYLAQLFEGSISGIDKGQWEAAVSLGMTKRKAFTGIILPQAIRNMIPGYFSQIISLMKETAIVGYVAVVDLTRAGDIIRSATFEAFAPLLAVAIIYFIIACILISLMKKIQKILAPKRQVLKKGGASNDKSRAS